MMASTVSRCKRFFNLPLSNSMEEAIMAPIRIVGQQLLSLLAAGWMAMGWVYRSEAWATPYDPFIEDRGALGPWISNRLPRPVRQKIESASAIAMDRIQRYASCASMFEELGEDGVEVIRRTLYYPADLRMEQSLCWKAYAFTKVGVRPTWICRKLWLLPAKHIALVLLHEALHHAGPGDSPHGSSAPHSLSTTHRVATACGF